MEDTPWDAVFDISFKSVPISEPLKNAVQLLRDTTQMKLVGQTTTAAFLAEMRNILAAALWKDVKAAVHQMGAPDISTHALPQGGGKPIPVGLKTMETAMGMSGFASPSQSDQSTMLLVLSRCVTERIAVVQEMLLTQSGDWWIKLLLVDIRNWMGSAAVELEEMESG